MTWLFKGFARYGPHIWIDLPSNFRHCETISSFKIKLNTLLSVLHLKPDPSPVPMRACVCVAVCVHV